MLEPLLKQAGELPSLPEVYIRVTELGEIELYGGANCHCLFPRR